MKKRDFTKPHYISNTVKGMHYGFVADQARALCGSVFAIAGNTHPFEAHCAVTVRKAIADEGWIAKVIELKKDKLYQATLVRLRHKVSLTEEEVLYDYT